MGYLSTSTSSPQIDHDGAKIDTQANAPRLVDLYHSYFDILPVKTAEQQRAAFRLRYQVYCVENPFEDPARNASGLEIDAFDASALHSLLIHRATGEVVGTVRLILPQLNLKGAGLPIREICGHELMARDNQIIPWAGTAEISRFAVSKTLRRRAGDGSVVGGAAPADHDPRRKIPDASLGLMQAVIAMASKTGVTHLCAAMEPSLLRMLRRLGMVIPSLGPEVNHHGWRQPCYSHLDTALTKIWLQRPEIWEVLTRDGDLWPLNTGLVAWLRKRDSIAAACA